MTLLACVQISKLCMDTVTLSICCRTTSEPPFCGRHTLQTSLPTCANGTSSSLLAKLFLLLLALTSVYFYPSKNLSKLPAYGLFCFKLLFHA